LKGEIDIQRVTFRYGKNEPAVLDDVSTVIAPGEFVALVGPSGSGKSTLLRLVLGFEKAESGTILFDGRPIENLDLGAMRRDMGVVLQNGRLSPGSLYENIIGHSGLTIEDAWYAGPSLRPRRRYRGDADGDAHGGDGGRAKPSRVASGSAS